LPDFSGQRTKIEKYIKGPQNVANGRKIHIPNGGKIDRMATKYTKIGIFGL
jgi:hypothetical protein